MACTNATLTQNTDTIVAVDNVGFQYIAGQSFTLPTPSIVCGVSLYGGYGTTGGPGTFRIEIRENGIDGNVLATTGELDQTAFLQSWETPDFTQFEFTTPVDLEANSTYYIVSTGLTGAVADIYRIGRTADTYLNGNAYYSLTPETNIDLGFKVHGEATQAEQQPMAFALLSFFFITAVMLWGSTKIIGKLLGND